MQSGGKNFHMAFVVDSTMASSVTCEIIPQKESKFLHENFDAVQFSGGYCFATYSGNAESLNVVLDTGKNAEFPNGEF